MSLAGPEPLTSSPWRRLAFELRQERRAGVPYPPGDVVPSVLRTRRMATAPLPLLLDAYQRHGPVFALRILTTRVVFMLGPAANHHMLVSHPHNFRWRDGGFGDLVPLLGDGLLTIDGDFHRRSRRIMLPAFHRERIAASAATMRSEAEHALAGWREGTRVDLYHWARRLALRVAMRALFGLDPDARYPAPSRRRRHAAGFAGGHKRAQAGADSGLDPAREFERALHFYGCDYFLQTLRGPRTPFARMMTARRRLDALIYAEIARRRRPGDRGDDILSLLLDAEDEDGTRLSDRHVRDEVMTLMFAGHDTTTSTVSFLFYELARRPDVAARVAVECDRVLGASDDPTALLMSGAPAELEMALDETLRLYPPAWVGPRRSVEPFEFAGHRVPGGVPVNYCSWASHHLPDVWGDPEAFRPERFAPDARAALPRGAYVPFGAGSRTCLGMRFGQLEIRTIAAAILARFTLELAPRFVLRTRQTPTIGPVDGLPMIVRERRA